MATLLIGNKPSNFFFGLPRCSTISCLRNAQRSPRRLQSGTKHPQTAPNFAFAFDIDGVLLRSSKPLPRARKALTHLQAHRIPFILLTNGGGKLEQSRVNELSNILEIPLHVDMFVQSHTPFAQLVDGKRAGKPPLRNKCILVCGGEGDECRRVAENYGFANVLTPSDLITAFPTLWPFANKKIHTPHAQPLPQKVLSPRDFEDVPNPDHQDIKIDAIFIFHDPRDWALDTQIILDLLLSRGGHLGSLSQKNGNESLPNSGYLQEGQPPLYFSNPDLFWASEYHLPRLGQGGFREAFEGVWRAVTGGEEKGVHLDKKMFGKPSQNTFKFAENCLRERRNGLYRLAKASKNYEKLRTVYMVGDNPESDIAGANYYASPHGTKWHSILVRSGVYSGGDPTHKPKVILDDVWDAVQWGMEEERPKEGKQM
ncbi:hypothetical protein MMC28_006840 [Mycoblastus sanguinarius]|nr:hypothetical protein [Mycoblastus sanguinarius]